MNVYVLSFPGADHKNSFWSFILRQTDFKVSILLEMEKTLLIQCRELTFEKIKQLKEYEEDLGFTIDFLKENI